MHKQANIYCDVFIKYHLLNVNTQTVIYFSLQTNNKNVTWMNIRVITQEGIIIFVIDWG